MDQLRKDVAELALRLAALPAEGSRSDNQLLDAVEQLATRVLKEVSAIRADGTRSAGETRGMWRVVQPLMRQ